MQAPVGSRQVETDASACLVVLGVQRQLGLFEVAEHSRTGAVERRAGVGQRQSTSGPLEQAQAEAVFQPGNGLAHRRGGQVQSLRRRAEAAGFGDADEDVYAFQTF